MRLKSLPPKTTPPLHLVVTDQPTPVKVDILDEAGVVVGSRQVRDRKLLGLPTGYKQIFPQAGEPLEPLHLRATPRLTDVAATSWPGSEVKTLVQQGPSKNRIDLTIVGDGYTPSEKDKFFADAKRITDDLFGLDTFKSYLPLFNVHAVFVPSNKSGIGDGRPSDTALGLYRHPTMRQAVMPGNEKAAKRASELAPDTDYPIIVGNDRLYGGLGGTFAITTAAPLNITTVLRHELGHNFGRVGEEYDGGQVYDGANFSSSTNVPWRHFISGKTEVHDAQLLHYSAPWKNLGGGTWQTDFTTPSSTRRVLLDFSSLGFDSKNDVELLIDGKAVPYDGSFNYDRNFYKVRLELPAGKHTMTVREAIKDGNNVISKVGIYALPADYPDDVKVVGAFGTYDENNRHVGYRPTGADCIMRDMTLRHFCPACQENLWRNFLREVSLIDGITQSGGAVKAGLIPLGDRLRVEWLDPKGNQRHDLDGKTEWTPTAADKGSWKLRVRFVSDEIKDPSHDAWSVHTAAFELA